MNPEFRALLDELALQAFWRERKEEPPLTLAQKFRYVFRIDWTYLRLSNFHSVRTLIRWWPHNAWQEVKRMRWRSSIFNERV